MKLDSVIFCEDIRTEIHNKHSLIGIYSDKIRILVTGSTEKIPFPIHSRLSCYIRLLNEKTDSLSDSFEFQFLLPSKQESSLPAFSGGLVINKENKYSILTISVDGLPIEPGFIGFRLAIKNKDTLIKEFREEAALQVTVEKSN